MRSTIFPLLACAAMAMPVSAHADRLPVPTGAPPSFQAECGGCHMPFPPALLTAPDWKRVMSRLDKHYGDNATLDEKTRHELESFHVRNAATDSRMGGGGDPPRLTASAWFKREHRKVSDTLWRDPRVKSAANCAGCHPRAEAGNYSESDISLPELHKEKKSWLGED